MRECVVCLFKTFCRIVTLQVDIVYKLRKWFILQLDVIVLQVDMMDEVVIVNLDEMKE